jgi:acetyltransferase-like isoleucine patch superfamily enzyme
MLEFVLEELIRVRAYFYTRLLSLCLHRIGRYSVIVPPLRYHNLCKIQIGKNVLVQSYCWLQVVDEGNKGKYPHIVIKDHAKIGMNTTITAAEKIVIEEYVLLGRNVHIADHGHEFADITVPIVSQGIRNVMPVRIGAESWIGANAAILPGAQIGRHCVIGANAVVNSVIPDYSVAVGAPAKIIKQYNSATARWEPVS